MQVNAPARVESHTSTLEDCAHFGRQQCSRTNTNAKERSSDWADVWIGRSQDDFFEDLRADEHCVIDILVVAYILDPSAFFAAITKRVVYWTSKAGGLLHCNDWYVDIEASDVLPHNLYMYVSVNTRNA